jgi:hypothetical protein
MSRRWLAVIMMTTTVCLGGTVVPPVDAASPVAVAVNPKATYLRTDPTDAAAMNAVAIDLGALGFLPGMTIQLSVIGEYRAAVADTDRRSELVAVFSNGPTLLARNQPNRVPGALETGFDVKTLVTFPGRLATDLRQDFLVTPAIRVKIPVGASHLFVSPNDDFFGDNSDDNGNFAVRIAEIVGAPIVDAFNGPPIDPTAWHGGEGSGDSTTASTSTSRGIRSGRLAMSLTSFGSTHSDEGTATGGNTHLRLNNPEGVTFMSANVAVTQAVAEACPANPSETRPRARLFGAYFNDGSSADPSDATGDVRATIQMILGSTTGPRFVLQAFRCDDAQCSISVVLDAFVPFVRRWAFGQTHRLSILWDQANHRFVGTVDPGPNQEVQTIEYGALVGSDTAPPAFDFKELRVQNSPANCTADSTRSEITATFDSFTAQ